MNDNMSDKKEKSAKPKKKSAKPSLLTASATVSLRHDLTDKEYREVGAELSAALNELARLEGEWKSIHSDYKARIQAAEGRRDELNNKLGNGYEMRQTKVTVRFEPKRGVKVFFSPDDKRFKNPLGEAPMQPADYQQDLPLAEPGEKAPPKSDPPPIEPGRLTSVGEALERAEAASEES